LPNQPEHFRCGTKSAFVHFERIITERFVTVPQNRFHARQAVAALLKMAKTTSDPRVAAGLIEIAADLKDQAGELPHL
jgi:hypothetical protein